MINEKILIKVRRRTQSEVLIYLILFTVYLEGVLSIFIPGIHAIYYIVDLLNIALLIGMIRCKKFSYLLNSPLRLYMLSLFIFFFCSLFSTVVNFSNPVLHLWGYRTIFTNILFFIACVSFENSNNTRFINILFIINFIMSMIEILLGFRQDFVGGIYGISRGQVNGPLNLLLIIVLSKVIIEYLNKNRNLLNVLFYVGFSLIIAAFAELKIFFVEILVIILLCSFVTKFSYKKLILVLLGITTFIVGVRVLIWVFPVFNSDMLSINYIWRYLTNPGGYTGQFAGDLGDLNRLSFWSKCMKLLKDPLEKIFGLGIGNCEHIDAIGLNSNFYNQYGFLNYFMFPLPMILLQQGVVGMIMYLIMFISIFICILKTSKINTHSVLYKSNKEIALVLCIMAFIITIYDTSLFGKGGFLFYYMMALPFIKKNMEEKNDT